MMFHKLLLFVLRIARRYSIPFVTAWALAFTAIAYAVPTETFLLLCEAEERRLPIGQMLTEDIKLRAEEGDCYHVISVPSHEHVITLEVPPGTRQSRLKRRSLVTPLKRLQAWLAKGALGPSRQLKLYGLAESISNLRKYADSKCRVVLVGTPVFMDEHYAGLNMQSKDGETLLPKDGWLASGARSPFAPSSCTLPHRTRATWITSTSLWGPTNSKEHRLGIARFYHLWFASQNSSMLVRFSSSPRKAFDFKTPDGYVKLHMKTERADMQRVHDATQQAELDPAEARKVRVVPEPQHLVGDKQSFLPGVCWKDFLSKHHEEAQGITILRLRYCQDESPSTATDVDIHLVENETGDEIWFEHPRVKGLGRLFNDVRVGSAKTEKGEPIMHDNYEFILLEPGTNLADCTIWVDKYLGVDEVVFEISIMVQGEEVGSKQFSFETPKGDLGQDADNRAASENWMRIDLQEILGEQELTSR